MTSFKKVSITRTDLLGANDETESTLIHEIFYDSDGNEIERYNYSPDGELEEHIITKIENGKIIEVVLEINGEITERTTHRYDEKGRIIEDSRYYLEGGTDIAHYEYNGEHLISKTIIDSDGEEGEREIKEYHDGKLTKEILINAFGNIELEKSYEYDQHGKISSITEITNSGDSPEKTISLFEEDGKMMMEKKYDSRDRLIARTTVKYNETGKPVLFEEETQRGKKLTSLEYDDAGNNTHQEEINDKGERLSLVERVFNESGHPVEVEVIMEPGGYQSGHHYKLKYLYE